MHAPSTLKGHKINTVKAIISFLELSAIKVGFNSSEGSPTV